MISVVALSFAWLANAQAPVISPGGVGNAASYASGGIAPGSIVSIFGTNLASETASASSVPLPMALGNVISVTFSGVPAPLYFVSPGQINAQVPWNVLPAGIAGGPVGVQVTTGNGSSLPESVQVVQALPGIFTESANGIGQAIATDNADGAIVAPAGSTAGAGTHPIQIGSYLIVWCTGLGAVDAAVANGANTGGTIVNTLLKPTVLIGGVQATSVYSVLSPQYAGEYQVAVQVAPGTPTGNAVPLQIQMNGTTTFGNVTIAVAGGTPAFQPLNTSCTLTSTGCTEINLPATDPASSTKFAGYADATIRQDPLTGTLWMAYSWPHTIPSGTAGVAGTQVLDIHLSSSTDGGKSWTYAGPLYTSEAVANPETGNTDYTANEVMNLFPQVVNGVTWWYGIHATYNVPQSSGGGSGLENYTKRWAIGVAPGTATTGPMGLATATLQYLGQSNDTDPQDWPVSYNLSSLDPEVSGCTQFFEPALIESNYNLYLFLACTPDNAANRFYAVFKASDPQDTAPNWQWTYVQQGATKFANQNDAVSVGSNLAPGATYITQMDIAPSQNPGILLAIMTAAYDNASGKVSLGCAAAELASIDPPKFVYNAEGQVQVDAFLTSPDSQTGGPGSCTYSPYSATGMILAHRQSSDAPQNGGFFTFLMQSFLFP
jgi:uncharacterized protein (TIGR03437 family)